ncbi:MAG: hypothetical protein EBX02_00760, partial [Betaproteobacteria bacterium]|nr:hypothetical protein [Betaproteobacteria bacterium]
MQALVMAKHPRQPGLIMKVSQSLALRRIRKPARKLCESLWSAWHRAEIRNPVLLAIGGGSVMDLAKLARWFPDSAQRERLRDFHDEAWLT